MNIIGNVLDEQFFVEASDTCLKRLAPLIDDALAVRLKEYLKKVPAGVASDRIQEHLLEAIKLNTFHLELLEKNYVKDVKRLMLPTILDRKTDLDELLEELLFLQNNMPYIINYCKVRNEEDYEEFYESLPANYTTVVEQNKIMFYSRNERERRTGVGVIRDKRHMIDIAIKGIEYRKYMTSIGADLNSYKVKEF